MTADYLDVAYMQHRRDPRQKIHILILVQVTGSEAELDLSFSNREPGSTSSSEFFRLHNGVARKSHLIAAQVENGRPLRAPSLLMDRHLSPVAFYGAI